VLIIIVFGLILGVSFFHGYGPVMTVLSILGILLFVGIFSLGFLFLSATISMRMETPEGVNGIITLLSMPLFFVSNALYPVDAFPPVLQYASRFNPLNPLITGVRYFAIGPEYYAFGSYYVLTVGDLLSALAALLIFAILMFAIAWRTFQKAVVTA
jgi:ABC-2 type transport system permease protein